MGKFQFIDTKIAGVVVIEPTRFGDERGYFTETYNERDFSASGLEYRFVQDNQSSSRYGVLRGLHFQKNYPQAKLVRVLRGRVLDAAVDLRAGSATYGEWVAVELSAENMRQLMIPRGFAHGFAVLSETAEFCYKCDEFYHPEDEGGILWNDPALGIDWRLPAADVVLSDKDKKFPKLSECQIKFEVKI